MILVKTKNTTIMAKNKVYGLMYNMLRGVGELDLLALLLVLVVLVVLLEDAVVDSVEGGSGVALILLPKSEVGVVIFTFIFTLEVV
jgi:hypothetical protein